MKTSEALKLAKQFLAKNYDELNRYGDAPEAFVCMAVAEAGCRCLISIDVEARIRQHISGLIYPFETFECWLRANHNISRPKYVGREEQYCIDVRQFEDKLQATRHAWVDSMIAEFQTKGD